MSSIERQSFPEGEPGSQVYNELQSALDGSREEEDKRQADLEEARNIAGERKRFIEEQTSSLSYFVALRSRLENIPISIASFLSDNEVPFDFDAKGAVERYERVRKGIFKYENVPIYSSIPIWVMDEKREWYSWSHDMGNYKPSESGSATKVTGRGIDKDGNEYRYENLAVENPSSFTYLAVSTPLYESFWTAWTRDGYVPYFEWSNGEPLFSHESSLQDEAKEDFCAFLASGNSKRLRAYCEAAYNECAERYKQIALSKIR